jgi:L-rhamnose isomerase
MEKQTRILPGVTTELFAAVAVKDGTYEIDGKDWHIVSWQSKSYGNRFELFRPEDNAHMILETVNNSAIVTTYIIERS